MKTRILPILFVLTAIVSGGCRPATSPHVEMSPGEQIVKAIADNDAAMVRSLLAKTPELIRETDKRGTTLLHYAARVSTDPAVLQALLDAGADLNARDDKDWPPVYCALYHRNKPATEFLLKQKVDAASYPDTKTLIENAVRWNADAGALRILLANHHENWVVTSLTLTAARFNDDPEVMRLLLEHGGDPNASEMHTTVMHYAAAKSPDVKTLQYLLDRKAKIDPRPSETDENAPNTPLHYAAKNNPKVEISQWLIEHGADPFAKNNGGETPCDYAVRYNSNIDVVRFYYDLFKQKEAGRIDKARLLNFAQTSPHKETFVFLVREFLDPAEAQGAPLSRYMPFCGQMDARIWDVLLEYGADLHGEDEQGRTAFDIAEQYDEWEYTRFVEEIQELEKRYQEKP